MTRSTALLDELLRDQTPEPWNLAWRRIKAKTIPLGERPITSQVPAERRTSIEDVIAPEPSSRVAPQQYRQDEQQLTESEREILDTIRELGGFASAPDIAERVGCSAQGLRRGELHDLAVKGAIRAVHGRGWEVVDGRDAK